MLLPRVIQQKSRLIKIYSVSPRTYSPDLTFSQIQNTMKVTLLLKRVYSGQQSRHSNTTKDGHNGLLELLQKVARTKGEVALKQALMAIGVLV